MDRIYDLDDSDLIQLLDRIQGDLMVLASLRDELREIGINAARAQAARGVPFAEAVYDSMPDGCPIGGQVWGEIERGFRMQWDGKS